MPEKRVRLKSFGVMLARVWHIALLLAPTLALADSWMPPHRKDYFSSDNAYSFTVLPREIDNALSYFEDRVAGRGQAGQRKGGQRYCLGVLWKWKADGSVSQVWRQDLRNDVAVDVHPKLTQVIRYLLNFKAGKPGVTSVGMCARYTPQTGCLELAQAPGIPSFFRFFESHLS